MRETIKVFVNGGAVDLPVGADVSSAVRALDPALDRQIAAGSAYVTDGRGIEIDSTSVLAGGAILRVIVRARRSDGADADT